jgi:ABC-type glutathione transport system ATPase component
VEFAELENWIEEPVKHYSSGMYVRLGFAVAVEVDPDILIIDEVLAVGDAAFQRKCIARIEDFKRRGKTMLVVSHDLGTIHRISEQLILLDEGRVLAAGEPSKVVAEYQWLSRRKAGSAQEREWGTREVVMTRAEFVNEKGEATNAFVSGQPVEARLYYEASRPIADPVFGFAVYTASGTLVYGNNTQIEGYHVPQIEGQGHVTLRFPQFSLLPGAYLFSFSVHSQDHKVNYHRLENTFPITVSGGKRCEGICFLPVQWGGPGA